MANFTEHYQLHQWEENDNFLREDFNEDFAKIDGGLAAAQAAGDRGLDALRKMMGDVCRLAYQADGKGIYTGFRQGFDFDGLNADHRVESTTGAAVLEPDNGRGRMAVSGWTGGSVSWSTSTASMTGGGTTEVMSEEWAPVGYSKIGTLTFTLTPGTGGVNPRVNSYVELLLGDEVLSTTDTLLSNSSTGSLTYTFSTTVTLDPKNVYQLNLVMKNPTSNTSFNVALSTAVTITTTAVTKTDGGFTTETMTVGGQDVEVWVQADEGVSVTAELETADGWTAMEAAGQEASQTPEGTACVETRFLLTLDNPQEGAALRFTLTSSDAYVYGYGAVAI